MSCDRTAQQSSRCQSPSRPILRQMEHAMRLRLSPLLRIPLTADLFEWYEFSLTAFMALEISRLFFPATSEKTALMLSFSVFASSYLARPFGSVFFGVLGNRRGAGAALKLSMIG